MNENIGLRGVVTYTVYDKCNNIKEMRVVKNQIQNLGVSAIMSLISADNPGEATAFDYIAIGTGSGVEVTDNALDSEITTNGGSRRGGENVTASLVETEFENDSIKFETIFAVTEGFAVTEAGIFDNTLISGTSKMLCYQDFDAINLMSGDSLKVEWKIVGGRAGE